MLRSVEQLLPAVTPGPGLGLLPSLCSMVPLVSSAVSQLLPQLGVATAGPDPGSSCGEGRAVLRGWLSEQHTRDLVMLLTVMLMICSNIYFLLLPLAPGCPLCGAGHLPDWAGAGRHPHRHGRSHQHTHRQGHGTHQPQVRGEHLCRKQ